MSGSLRYFTLGDIQFMDQYGYAQGNQSPNEFAVDLGYTRLLSENFSGAVALRYIRSDLTGGQEVNGVATHAGSAYAADVAFYYQNEIRMNRKNSTIAAGINISNIGSKISYTDGETKDFIPTNLRLGASYKTEMDRYNTIMFTFDANKLLVPTPKVATDDIVTGSTSSKSPIAGIFSSFGDAPGGMKEEFKEINFFGRCRILVQQTICITCRIFLRRCIERETGNFSQQELGLKMNVFALDFSYLLPVAQNNPLANTLRFTLMFDLEAFNKQKR